MARRYRDPRDKVANALNDYWALKEANPARLSDAILNMPEDVQIGMFHTALEIIFTIGERGKNENYPPGSKMELYSIQARELTGDL